MESLPSHDDTFKLRSIGSDGFNQILESLPWKSIALLAATGNKYMIAKISASVHQATLNTSDFCYNSTIHDEDELVDRAVGTSIIFGRIQPSQLKKLSFVYDLYASKCPRRFRRGLFFALRQLKPATLAISDGPWPEVRFWSAIFPCAVCLKLSRLNADGKDPSCLPTHLTKLSIDTALSPPTMYERLRDLKTLNVAQPLLLEPLQLTSLANLRSYKEIPNSGDVPLKMFNTPLHLKFPIACTSLVHLRAPHVLLSADTCLSIFPPTLEILHVRFPSILYLQSFVMLLPNCKFIHALSPYTYFSIPLISPRSLPPSAHHRVSDVEAQTCVYPRLFYHLLQDDLGPNRFEIRAINPSARVANGINIRATASQIQSLFSPTITSVHYLEKMEFVSHPSDDKLTFLFAHGMFLWSSLSQCRSLRELVLRLIPTHRSQYANWMLSLCESCPQLELLDVGDYPFPEDDFKLPLCLTTLRSAHTDFIWTPSHVFPPALTELSLACMLRSDVTLPPSLTALRLPSIFDHMLLSVLKHGNIKIPISVAGRDSCNMTITGRIFPAASSPTPLLLSDLVLGSLQVIQQAQVGAVSGIGTLLSDFRPGGTVHFGRRESLHLEAIPVGVTHIIVDYTEINLDLRHFSVTALELLPSMGQWAKCIQYPRSLHTLILDPDTFEHGIPWPSTITKLKFLTTPKPATYGALPRGVTSLEVPLASLPPASQFASKGTHIRELISSVPNEIIPAAKLDVLAGFVTLTHIKANDTSFVLASRFKLRLPNVGVISPTAIYNALVSYYPVVKHITGNYTFSMTDNSVLNMMTSSKRGINSITEESLKSAVHYVGRYHIGPTPLYK